ncbi:LysR family transcriptional regulator [Virgibacillus sp. C22-A2]|uniref:LysR family transcriptional regulator n=1 Tax=Virgibacillus tibetensis TaxID=3042313 RepID=A0ABU6KDA6_9BACI|nr:LysR family transcriptional regulator [Virgibacillus sp. C22-A2]
MNEKDCAILIILDEERNMTRAAAKLFISQPALTYRLRRIEQAFNVTIFARENSGLSPTPQGELILQYARDNLLKLETTMEAVQLMDTEIRGTVKLGVASSYGQYMLPNLLNSFRLDYPEVNFQIITGLSSAIFSRFDRGDVHIGIFRGDFYWQEEKDIIASEPICVVSKYPVTIEELPELPQIEYHMDTYLKTIVKDWWNKTFSEDGSISMTVDSLETAKEMVRAGLGYTILPGICLTGEKELCIQPIVDEEQVAVERITSVYCRHQTLQYAAVHKFYTFLKDNSIEQEKAISECLL